MTGNVGGPDLVDHRTVSERATDPVCGMTVDPATARGGSWVHDGCTYHFCNPRCRERFAADPTRYLRPVAAEPIEPRSPQTAVRPPAEATEYTCPMHPEVVRPGPGACPICGMALEPRVISTAEPLDDPELADMQRRLVVAAVLTIPTAILGMADMIPGRPLAHAIDHGLGAWIQLMLSAPVVLWGGWPFFARGWASIVQRSPNMFTLIALGTGAAFGFSVFATLFPGSVPASAAHDGAAPVYFESAAVIVTLVLLGQVLELRARRATSGALRGLLGLAPKLARRVDSNGGEHDVALDQVVVGDRLRLRPGERIPVDGRVIEGNGAVDESTITGEPIPVEKGPEDPVTAGTTNLDGTFVMRAERVGADTLLARIVALVAQAQRSRAPIQRLADAVAAYFVPAVVLVAIATALVWGTLGPEPRLAHALVNAVAVLIVACPCALGLATPMSIMVGTGRGARAGVLIKNAEALEAFERVDTLVVDKTGTLTEGRPRLAEVIAAPGFVEDQVLATAAAVERGSEHPLAAAIVAGALERGSTIRPVGGFRALVGRGVVAEIDGTEVVLGNALLLRERGIEIDPLVESADRLRHEGRTVVFVALGGRAAGLLAVVDPIKASTPEALGLLRSDGLHVVMLTGDDPVTAHAVATTLGIAEVHAGVLPADKHRLVTELQAAGRIVAMAGDGTNDAPALAAARVGIAMGTGTDVAIDSASITLVRGDLMGIVRARRLSVAVMRNVRGNLFFAFAYNVLGVPIAAGVAYPLFGLLLSPMLASAAMSFSSVSVIANALRLRSARL